MSVDRDGSQLNQVERKLDRLINLMWAQLAIITVAVVSMLPGMLTSFVVMGVVVLPLMLIVALPLVALLHRFFPRWGRAIGRFVLPIINALETSPTGTSTVSSDESRR